MFFKIKYYQSSLLVVMIVFAFSLLSFAYAAWQEPSLSPPDGNVDAPLNAGSIGQSKKGGLILNTGTPAATNGLIVQDGNVILRSGIGPGLGNFKLTLYGSQSNNYGIYISTSGSDFHGKLWINNNLFNIGSTNNTPIALSTNGTERVRIATTTGNVGIGTTSPGYRLDVNGDINIPASGVIRIAGSAGSDKQVLTRTGSGMIWQTPSGGIGGSGTNFRVTKFVNNEGTIIGNSQIVDTGMGVSIGPGESHPTFPKLTIWGGGDNILELRGTNVWAPVTIFKVGTDGAMVINNDDTDILTLKNGNVGIGTTDPETSLHVLSTPLAYESVVKIDAKTTLAIGPILRIAGTGTGINPARLEIRRLDTNNKEIALRLANVGYDKVFDIKMPANSNDVYFDLLGVGGETDFVIKDITGNVGIGTATPTQKLYVSGNIHATGNITCGGSCGGASQWTASGNNIYNSNSGNVGIGTLVPTNKLTIQSSFPQIGLWGPAHAWALGAGANAFAIQDTTDNVFRLWIANNGNIGIGTTSPGEKLEIIGNIRLNATSAERTMMFGQNSANIGFFGRPSDSAVGMYDWANGKDVWTYYPTTNYLAMQSNRIGIGTATPGYKLDVAGRANATELCIAGSCRGTWPSNDFIIVEKVMATTTPGGILLAGCPDDTYRRIACSGGLIHTGNESNEDNEAFIVRPSNDDYTCEIEWEDDPVGGKQVEVYAYCTKK